MTQVSASSSLTTTKLGVGAASEREKLSAAAKQFEAVFVRQMLAAARKADFGGDELFGGQATQTFREMQDNHFADVTAETGTLGFAARIEAQLARFLPPSAAPGTSPTAPEGAK
jgi:flagellar protein FlgJ